MSVQKKSRTRTVIFVIIFVLIAGVIIFMSQKSEYSTTPTYGDPYSPGMVDSYDDGLAAEPSMLERGMDKMAINNNGGMEMEESLAPQMDIMPIPSAGGDPTAIDKKIIKTGNVTMMVNSVEPKVREITDIARHVGGDVMNANVTDSGNNLKSGVIVVKVPSDRFSEAFERIVAVASVVTHQSQNQQDVTEQFVDLEAQLKNKKAEEQRITRLYEKADEIEDILKIETQLSRVRGEIERMEGRMRYLENQTSFSTITARLSEDTKIIASTGQWRPWQDAKEAMRILVDRTQELISSIIVFTISKLPFIILAFIAILILVKIGKVIFKKFADDTQE